jgi:hypothetical protein
MDIQNLLQQEIQNEKSIQHQIEQLDMTVDAKERIQERLSHTVKHQQFIEELERH